MSQSNCSQDNQIRLHMRILSDFHDDSATVWLVRSTTWAQRLASLLLLSIGVAIPLAWVTGGYMNMDLTEMMGFLVNDGWCESDEALFGQHCFGDIAIVRPLLDAPTLWDQSNSFTTQAYPPTGWVVSIGVYLIFNSVGGLKLATTVFLTIALIASLAPAMWVARGNRIERASIAFLSIGLGAAPILLVLDRGNSTALLVPPLLAFAIGLFRDKSSWIVAGAVASTLLKPQMILLVVALIALRKYRLASVTTLLSAVGILLSFLLWPGNRVQNFANWVRNLLSYSDYGPLNIAYPYNLSVTRSLITLSEMSGISRVIGDENWGHVINLLTRFSALPGILVLISAVLILVAKRKSVDPLTALFVSVSLIIIVPGTSFSYYLVLFLPVAAMILKDPRSSLRDEFTQGDWRGVLDNRTIPISPSSPVRSWTSTLVIVFVLCLWVIPLPSSLVPGFTPIDHIGIIQVFWGPVILVGVATVLVSLLFAKSDVKKS